METIFLDADLYDSKAALYQALRRLLNLDEPFGLNADALHDRLSEKAKIPSLVVYSMGRGEVQKATETVCTVFEDLGGKVTRR